MDLILLTFCVIIISLIFHTISCPFSFTGHVLNVYRIFPAEHFSQKYGADEGYYVEQVRYDILIFVSEMFEPCFILSLIYRVLYVCSLCKYEVFVFR